MNTLHKPLRTTAAFLGTYAGLLAALHGIFGLMQGRLTPSGIIIQAIGPPCRPEAVWHACFPAMTLMPDLFVGGIVTVITGLCLTVWSLGLVQRRYGGLVLGVLALMLLFVGGGFVPVFIGLAAAGAGSCLPMKPRPGGKRWRSFGRLWPWPLVLMAIWFPVSWLLGHFFNQAMLAAGLVLFFVCDISLPVLAVVSAFARDKRAPLPS